MSLFSKLKGRIKKGNNRMFDAAYYQQKQIKVTNKIVKLMETALSDVTQTLQRFYEEKNSLVAELQEITKIQKEAEAKPEAPVEPKPEEPRV